MRKQLFSFALLLLAGLGFAHGQTPNYDFSAVCPSGDTLYYKINAGDTTASVVAPNFNSTAYSAYTWDDYTEPNDTLIIPAMVNNNGTSYPVTSIGSSAFYSCDIITSVTIPNTVISIGSSAFKYCTSLATVDIPNSVTSIGESAFYWVRHIVYNGIATGSPWGAYYMNGFENGDFIFSDSTMTSLVSYIGSNPVVNIPNSVTSIGENAFYGCTRLTSVTIPNSVTSIGTSAFDHCTNLASVFIPNSVTTIGDWAFNFCTSLASVSIPNTVTTIGPHAFSYCTSLASVSIPNSVTSIGESAFYHCTSLGSLAIGSSLNSIGNVSFGDCIGLRNISIFRVTPPLLYYKYNIHAWSSFNGVPSDVQVWVPCNAVGNYASASGWSSFSNISEMTDCDGHYWDFYKSTSVGNVVYYKILDDSASVAVVHPLAADTIDGTYWHGYSRTSGSLVIPDTVVHDSVAYVVRKIGSQAFKGCTGLTSVTIPATIDTIGNSAFANCYSLHTVWFNADSCHYMGEADSLVFQNDSYFHTLHIGPRIKNIPDYAFERCTGLTAINIPDSVVNIGAWSFAYDANVTDLTIGEGVEYIGEYAFYGCGRLRRVVVPTHFNPGGSTGGGSGSGGGSGWGSGAFGGCGFSSFTYPGGSIPSGLLAGNTELDTVYISDTITSIGDSAFFGCTSLTSISGLPELWIPRRVDSVGNAAYGNCIAATRIRYDADSCRTMGCDTLPVFMNDSNVAVINVGEHVRWIPDYAFLGCTGVDTINSNCVVAPLLGVDVFRDVPQSAVVNIPCGSLASYTARWPHFSNFVEMPFEDTIIVQTADSTMGTATVATMPGCDNGRTATITATANEGFRFVMWSDSVADNPRTLVVTHDTTLTALFDTLYVALTLSANNPDWGTVDGGGEYAYGTEVTITATANEGYLFSGWSDDNEENPRTVVVTEDLALTANFVEQTGIDALANGIIRVAPNPTSGLLTIQSDDVQQIEVYDLGGRKVLHFGNTNSIDLSALPSGTYYLHISCPQGTSVAKVVKQ